MLTEAFLSELFAGQSSRIRNGVRGYGSTTHPIKTSRLYPALAGADSLRHRCRAADDLDDSIDVVRDLRWPADGGLLGRAAAWRGYLRGRQPVRASAGESRRER